MSYTTIERVREISWFDNITNIPDALVSVKMEYAKSLIDSFISTTYSLPIASHKTNTITFSWTATGAGTMVITINSVNYNVSIVTADTASQVADKFRLVAQTSADFIIDDSYWSGEVVHITSLDCTGNEALAIAQVTVDPIADVQDISATWWVILNRYPKILDYLNAEIAAILLLNDNYWVEAQDTPKDGFRRLEEIKVMLWGKDGVPYRIFDDICNTELSASDTSLPSFYPNETSRTDEDDPTAPQIGMNDLF